MSRWNHWGLIAIAALWLNSAPVLGADISLKVMSINIGSAENSAANRDTLATIIANTGVNVVGVQQLGSDGTNSGSSDRLEVMRALLETKSGVKWYSFRQSADGIRTDTNESSSADEQILSRFPILQGVAALNPPTPSGHVLPQFWGGQIEITPGHNVWLMNTRLESYPYQAYGPGSIREGQLTTEAAVIAAATAARGGQLNDAIASMAAAGVNNGDPVFWTGDFNEPSHLDWTAAAGAASARVFDDASYTNFGDRLDWPTSTTVASLGFTDSYRTFHPDPIAKPGFTWTTGTPAGTTAPVLPTSNGPNGPEIHDRIDYTYHRGSNVTLTNSQTLGHTGTVSNPRLIDNELSVSNYNTDHAAVISSYTVGQLFDSVLTFSKLGTTNAAMPQTYGDRLLTTPNVLVSYGATGAGSHAATWKMYENGNWNKGGVAYLDSGSGELVLETDIPPAVYNLTFTPDPGHGVRVSSFDLLDFAGLTNVGQNVAWSLMDGATTLFSGTAHINDGQRLSIPTNMNEVLMAPLTLRLQHLAGGARNELALDTVAFSQVAAVPEPGTVALLIIGLAAGWFKARK